MGQILGIDLGSNSIGWAIVDTEKKEVINLGCKIYENPIDEIQINEVTVLNKSDRKTKNASALFIVSHRLTAYSESK